MVLFWKPFVPAPSRPDHPLGGHLKRKSMNRKLDKNNQGFDTFQDVESDEASDESSTAHLLEKSFDTKRTADRDQASDPKIPICDQRPDKYGSAFSLPHKPEVMIAVLVVTRTGKARSFNDAVQHPRRTQVRAMPHLQRMTSSRTRNSTGRMLACDF
jgi:hypothetical protein